MKPYTFCKKSIPFALAILSTVAFSSCQKDNPHLFRDKGWKSGNSLVFVAGYESDGVNTVAKCWINDQELTLPAGTNGAVANSIFVADNNVYIAGTDGGAVYWKNNIEKKLVGISPGTSANSIYVSGGHVYVAGIDGTSAVYWKDGTEIILNTTDAYGNSAFSGANSVFISGNDIYIAGFHGPNAVYWKDGVEVYLSNLTVNVPYFESQQANSIYVSGGNVYVVGIEYIVGIITPFGKYWKNGIDETATLNPSNVNTISSATSVFVSGNNVYISEVGFSLDPNFHHFAAYWNEW